MIGESAPIEAFSCSFESKEATAVEVPEVEDRREAEAHGNEVRVRRAEMDEMATARCSGWKVRRLELA